MKVSLSWRRLMHSLAWKLMPYAEMNIVSPQDVVFPVKNKQSRMLFGEMYMQNGYGKFLDRIPAPQSVVDLGCNCGYFPLVLEDRRRAGIRASSPQPARLLMVDADPECVELARGNLKANGLEETARLVHGLIGPAKEQVAFNVSKASGHSSIFVTYAPKKTLKMSTIDLDAIVDETFPGDFDLLKIDIEGGEKFVLLHAPRTVARARAVIIEWHQFAGPWEEIQSSFEKYGHKLVFLEAPEDRHQLTALLVRR